MVAEGGSNGAWRGDRRPLFYTFIASLLRESAEPKARTARLVIFVTTQ